MSDYFALLNQPRRAWLDPDELKQAFHNKSRELHPDSGSSSAAEADFAQLNEAHQVLREPKRRIQHLLTLEGRAPARDVFVPSDIADLFPIVASVTQDTDAVVQKMTAATNPLSRSLLKPQLLGVQHRVAETLQRIRELHAMADAELRRLTNVELADEAHWSQLHELYLRFSYLGRWISELEEKQVRLANT